MILNEFPDLHWLKRQIETRFSNQKSWDGRILEQPNWPNVIINTKVSQAFRDNIKGPLSIFYNLSGSSFIKLNGRDLRVEPDTFLISNVDQYYTLEIDQKTSTETFNIHFGESFTNQAFHSITSSDEKLLDQELNSESPLFLNRLQPINREFMGLARELQTSEAELEQEEIMFKLFNFIWANEIDLKRIRGKIPAVKKSSKEEILKRLQLTVDYIYSYYNAPLSLDELAQISNLSKFHFLRLFKETFDHTPHQFINKVRIRKATKLLRETKLEINQISEYVGFDNSSSFSRLFFKESGFYPSRIR